MIEEYIRAARRTKPPTEELIAEYQKHYECIKANVSSTGGYPALFVTYSSERRCELVRLGDKLHLVYDQYLGQSFNRLNRIQFAKNRPDLLSMAYACKFIAERLVTLNSIGLGAFFGLMSRQLEKNAYEKGDPFESLCENKLRYKMIAAQEMYVMAHELAHHRWSLDHVAISSEMSTYIEEFLQSGDEALSSTESSQPLSDHYRAILDSAGPEFREEIFADDFGGMIAMRAALTLGVRPWQTSLGVILAVRYLRLFRHLEIISHRMDKLIRLGQCVDFHSSLKSLNNDIWDPETGAIGRFQFREHFLRYRLRTDRKKLPDYDVSNEAKITAVIGDYDEKTEFPAVLELVDRLANSLTSSLLMEIERSIHSKGNISHIVDQLTGWQK
ncbi:hypothetical protein [Acidithiobacillus ferrianus]|uniref:hypothetical protein n=1 Tax=Acidithiobacillus ferrianus TaxID=2678518 RepID=UPI0034E4DA96